MAAMQGECIRPAVMAGRFLLGGIFMNALSELKNTTTYSGIEHRICEVNAEIKSSKGIKLRGRFFYLTFRDKNITEKEFAQFAYEKIIYYCIPRKKYNEAIEKFKNTGEARYITNLHDQAKNLFVKSLKEHGAQLGEPGELIAFIILEAFFDAPQIACKMFLKTSERMAVHGADSVHIHFSENDKKLELIWGEAKLYQELSSGFDKALESISTFINGSEDNCARPPHERDIDIIKDMPNVDNEEMKKALYDYFDPYSEESNNWKELFCCLVGFDYALYSNLQGASEAEIKEYFIKQYIERIQSASSLFESKIRSRNLTDLDFILVLLPFKSIDNFRKEFFNLLGVDGQTSTEASL